MESLNIKYETNYNHTDVFVKNIFNEEKIVKVDFMQDNQRQALRIAYCAGLLDGEGSFCFIKQNKDGQHKKHGKINPVYYGLIRIGLVSKEPLKFLDETFPGSIVKCEGVRKDRPTYQIMYRWEIRKRELLIPMIKQILPYLIVKRKQADTLLNALEDWKNTFNDKLGISKYELRRREEAYLKMRQLNAVGAAATTNPRGSGDVEVIV